jgi:hypothetical protein
MATIVNPEKLIITAASKAYGPSLLAMLGSLTLNWPQHPPVLVYDIGLDKATLATLAQHRIPVKRVPPFCPHWNKHFTWKIWCWNDAPARDIFWIDSGIVVLQPLDEVFETIATQGYAFWGAQDWLADNASAAALRGCGVSPDFPGDKETILAGFTGFRKQGVALEIMREALTVALTEECIRATHPRHRHDQAILSLLCYKHLGAVPFESARMIVENTAYTGQRLPGQKVWIHRRALRPHDRRHFIRHISAPGEPNYPQAIPVWRPLFYHLRWWLKLNPSKFRRDGMRE